jgi:GntR family transcriptional regulator
MDAGEDVRNALELSGHNAPVLRLVRERMANNEPLLLETTYIPLYLCPEMMEADFASKSLYQLLQSKYNLHMHKAIESYEAVKTDRDTASLLKVKDGTSAFRIHWTAYLENGIPFEYTHSITRSDKCIFRVELYASRSKVNFFRKMTL